MIGEWSVASRPYFGHTRASMWDARVSHVPRAFGEWTALFRLALGIWQSICNRQQSIMLITVQQARVLKLSSRSFKTQPSLDKPQCSLHLLSKVGRVNHPKSTLSWVLPFLARQKRDSVSVVIPKTHGIVTLVKWALEATRSKTHVSLVCVPARKSRKSESLQESLNDHPFMWINLFLPLNNSLSHPSRLRAKKKNVPQWFFLHKLHVNAAKTEKYCNKVFSSCSTMMNSPEKSTTQKSRPWHHRVEAHKLKCSAASQAKRTNCFLAATHHNWTVIDDRNSCFNFRPQISSGRFHPLCRWIMFMSRSRSIRRESSEATWITRCASATNTSTTCYRLISLSKNER